MGKSKDKHKQKKRKEEKKAKKKFKEKLKIDPRKGRSTKERVAVVVSDDNSNDFSIPVELMTNKSHAPETPEEYQQRQSRIRREIDPVTGRSRIIKGDGEVLEELVSKERHKAINKKATAADGNFFQENTLRKPQK